MALALALVATACSSSPGTTSSGTAAPATAGPSTSTTVSPAPDTVANGPVPAVTGATDLTREPGVAAGSGPAPTVLTGKDLVLGLGTPAGVNSTVKVQYVGALYDTGKVFDASWTDGSGPVTFPLSGVIPGFRDAIIGMKIGGRREVVIPPALGYGANGQAADDPGQLDLGVRDRPRRRLLSARVPTLDQRGTWP